MTKVLGTDTKLYTAFYYDIEGRVIRKVQENMLGGHDITTTTYSFSGKPLTVTHAQTASGKTSRTEVYTYTYDDAGRLINSNGDAITYDDQGRVISYGAATITYTSDGGKRVQNGDEVYEYDQHGNLIRYSDGDDYVEFEYREIRVTKAEAKRLAYFDLQRKIRDGRGRRNFTREYMCVPDYPEIPMLEYDLLINRGIY